MPTAKRMGTGKGRVHIALRGGVWRPLHLLCLLPGCFPRESQGSHVSPSKTAAALLFPSEHRSQPNSGFSMLAHCVLYTVQSIVFCLDLWVDPQHLGQCLAHTSYRQTILELKCRIRGRARKAFQLSKQITDLFKKTVGGVSVLCWRLCVLIVGCAEVSRIGTTLVFM